MADPISLDLGDPPRDIYTDLTNLPDPCKLGITARAYNYDDVTLYFKVNASAANWTFTEQTIGAIASGSNVYRNFDQFGSRAKPTTEIGENINITLYAYTDAGYTDLKWTFTRTVRVYFIDSSDPSYTVDEEDDFDDGTVQGWAVANELNNYTAGGYPKISVETDFVLSPMYSCRMEQATIGTGVQVRARLYKSFNTPNKNFVYAIIDIRLRRDFPAASRIKNMKVQTDDTTLVYLGRPYDAVGSDYLTVDKWFRIVVPLTKNTAVEIRLVPEFWANNTYAMHLYLDDFKIISKD